MKTRKLTVMGILLAMAAALFLVERQFLGGALYPGVKLGLANSVTMMVLLLYGPRDGLTFSVARVLLGSLISGTLGSVSFLLSLSGALVSTAVMTIIMRFAPGGLTLAGVGTLGGVSHNMGQLAVYAVLTGQAVIFAYGPKLVIFGSVSGFLLGAVMQALVYRLGRSGHMG